MFLSEQEYDRLARVRQDLNAYEERVRTLEEDNRRLREALEYLIAYEQCRPHGT